MRRPANDPLGTFPDERAVTDTGARGRGLLEKGPVSDGSTPLALRGNLPAQALPFERVRSRSQIRIAARFEGLELLEPGVVPCPKWRPLASELSARRGLDQYGGVARKP
ncbi:SAM-dependent methyltransferase [Nocardiopsis alba]|uniref:SAM-dependent methyltransferase n=1 Tax=Nocardiopsis alba TaxID=53437 RepID=UPI0033ADB681